MLKPTLPEKTLFARIAARAALLANERLQERGMVPESGAFVGRWTMDRKRQPTFALEPHALFEGYPFTDNVNKILHAAIQDAVDEAMDDYVAMKIQEMFSTRDYKPQTLREDDDDLRLF